MTDARAGVLALLGTDHHPFDRAVRWLDEWANSHPDIDVYVQHGRSQPPVVARGEPFLDHSTLRARLLSTDAVVAHGGPATIAEARAAGHRPVVVPRDPAHGEHVDDHQMRYTAWLATKDLIERRTDQIEFDRALEIAVARGRAEVCEDQAVIARSVASLGALINQAVEGQRPRPGGPVIVYIAGFGRSGSTLLERLLGESPGVTCLGEVVHLWDRALDADELCACGEPFSRCPRWQAIGAAAFGGWETVDLPRVRELRERVDRQRRIIRTAWPALRASARAELVEYASYYQAIYRAAADLSGASVVVDSSKHTSTAYALSHDADVDLRVLHLVRDPRAVAFSWSREVTRPEATRNSGQENMPTYSPALSARRWLTSNVLVDGLRLRGVPVARLHYEQLVSDPLGTLRDAARSLDLPLEPQLRLEDHTVTLSSSHSVAGNPMRFASGPVALQMDDEWIRAMPDRHRRWVGRATGPLHRAYRRTLP